MDKELSAFGTGNEAETLIGNAFYRSVGRCHLIMFFVVSCFAEQRAARSGDTACSVPAAVDWRSRSGRTLSAILALAEALFGYPMMADGPEAVILIAPQP